MRCPICNTENPTGVGSCSQCGFALDLQQVSWPQPTWLEIPLSAVEMPETPVVAPDRPATIEPVLAEPAATIQESAAIAPPLPRPAVPAEPARPPYPQQASRMRTVPPPPRATTGMTAGAGRSDAPTITRLALSAALAAAVLNGLGAILCLGFLATPMVGFLAGWRVRRLARELNMALPQPAALTVGAIVGLGGWLGEVIGHPLWLAATNADSGAQWASLLVVSCSLGGVMAVFGLLATLVGARSQG